MKPEDLIKGTWKHVCLVNNSHFVKNNPGVWLSELEKQYEGNIYGGYLEDRSTFFDERHDPKLRIHVGVDLWAPAGTQITFPYDSIVRFSRIATATRGGWGGRLDLQHDDYVYLAVFKIKNLLSQNSINLLLFQKKLQRNFIID